MNAITEYYGCLTKVENLWCLEEMGIPNTCILEARDAYPGYYGHIQGLNRPHLIFIMSTRKYSMEEVTRMTSAVRKVFPAPFSAAYCEITIAGRTAGGVRIQGINDYTRIRDLQMAYADHGLDLKKKEGNIENARSLIMVRKFFKLESFHNNIMRDTELEDTGYFHIEENYPWEKFESIIFRLRNNWNDTSFDAAKCFIFRNASIIDMVRIYSKDFSLLYLDKIRSAFLKAASY